MRLGDVMLWLQYFADIYGLGFLERMDDKQQHFDDLRSLSIPPPALSSLTYPYTYSSSSIPPARRVSDPGGTSRSNDPKSMQTSIHFHTFDTF